MEEGIEDTDGSAKYSIHKNKDDFGSGTIIIRNGKYTKEKYIQSIKNSGEWGNEWVVGDSYDFE